MRLLAGAMLAAVLLAADSGQDLFQKGLVKERTEADFRGAIKFYERVVKEYSSDRKLVAQALLRIAECEQELGSPEARSIYERVVREFADQSESATLARARLAALGAAKSSEPSARRIWLSEPGDEVDVNRPSADGRYLCFTDWGTGNINIRDLVSGTSRRLTDTGSLFAGGSGDYGYVCVISPDNRQAAYLWQQSKLRKLELRTISLNGGTPRTVPNFADYAEPQGWTPDGKKLLVMRRLGDGTGQLALVSVQDGSVQALKSFPWTKVHASLSPDGRFVAYHTPADAKTQAKDIFILAVDGSTESAAVQHPADDSFPVWSPDGSQIIFLSDRTGNPSLWSVPAKDGKATGPAELVKADIGAISPLGMTRSGALYYSPPFGFRPNVYSASLDANLKVPGQPAIAVREFLNSNTGPALSSDGQYLAYYSKRPGRLYLVIRTLKGGDEKEIPLSKGFDELLIFGAAPQWFPDGRSVLAVSRDSERGGFSFYRLDLGTDKTELLHHSSRISNVQVALSPDGKSIFHTEQGQQAAGVFRYDLDTRSETELKVDGIADRLAVSPDGKQLAVFGRVGGKTERYFVRVISTNGGDTREILRLSDAGNLNTLTWSRDQQYLIFARGGDNTPGTLWRIPVDGGQPEPMGLSMPATRILSPQVSSDGRAIFFSGWERAPEELWALENILPKAAK